MTVTAEELRANLDDPLWRISNLYKIIVKGDDEDSEGLVIQFKPNRAQRRLLQRLWHRNIILKARQLGFCLDPATRVLTSDLRWIPIGEMKAGMEVVSVDEHQPGGRGAARKMRTATVQAAVQVRRDAFRITFDDGRSVICTGQHPWLSKKTMTEALWRSIEAKTKKKLTVGTKVRWVTKPWSNAQGYEDGWFGGILDGEGSMSLASRAGANVCAAQREGDVWNRMLAYAENNGYNYRVEEDGQPSRPSKFGKQSVPKVVFSRMDELFRLIGTTRPSRFIGNKFWEGKELPGKRNGDVGWAKIVSIEPLGMQTMIDLQTSTGTYIAEGFVSHNTTLIAILWLDTALFSKDPIRCGIIAQDREAAEAIFRDKVKFAYNNLPESLRQAMPLETENKSELLFEHNKSSIRVATSMRSGTIHRLHVSEFGKICAKYPEKAKEVITGSIPAVPTSGILIIESTAEGKEGAFYEMTERARALHEKKAKLTEKDYRFHFFPWWEEPGYELDPANVMITPVYQKYFNEVEAKILRTLTDRQRAWYVATCESDFSGDQSLMWQEYPSFPEEAFQVSTEGCYYAEQLAKARKAGRIIRCLPMVPAPINTFWDIGRGDMTTIWWHQYATLQHRFLRYYENSGEDLIHYANYLQRMAQEHGYVYGTHYLPHDADDKRIGKTADTNQTIKDMLEELMPGQRFQVVPRVSNLMAGIQATRGAFASAWFDEENCDQGLKRVGNYRKKWNKLLGCWSDEDQQDDNCHGADAFRQWGQEVDAGNMFAAGTLPSKGPKRRGSAMAR